MSWVAAGVAVVGGGIQIYQGIQQKKAGEEMEAGLDKPEFQIPPEIAKNMSEAEMRSYQGLPDEQKAAFIDNQQRAAQTALRSSSDRRGGLGMVSQIQAQQDRSSLDLLQQDVAARDKNILRAQEARNVMASYRDKRFEHDYNEYSADLDYARAQVGAGMQNIAGGMTTAAGAVQSGIAHHQSMKSDKALFAQQEEANRLRQEQINATNNPSGSGIPAPKNKTLLPPTNTTGTGAGTVGTQAKNFITNESMGKGYNPTDQLYSQNVFYEGDYKSMSQPDRRLTKSMLRKANQGDPAALDWISRNMSTDGETNLPEIYKQAGVRYKMLR